MDSEDVEHFRTIAAQQRKPLGGLPSLPSEGSSASVPDPAYCLRRAQMLFGCYRKDEATDPTTYTSAIAAVMGEYSKAVVDYVTDPRTGLPSSIKFLPSVAEVREACDAQREKIARNAQPRRRPLPYTRVDLDSPGRRANVFVPVGPFYERARELAAKADPADWKTGKDGIWISRSLWGT